MKLIIARHGNTFDPKDKVVWVGSRNDLPLVSKGVAQAHNLAKDLKNRELLPSKIFSAPLQRTFKYAQIINEDLKLNLKINTDQRLTEIDYGPWTGLTTEEVAQQFGLVAQEQWNNASVWPLDAGWGGSEKDTIESVQSIASELSQMSADQDVFLIISSNGVIRYFLTLIENAFASHVNSGNFKVNTGAYCLLSYHDKTWSVEDWNISPGCSF